MAPGQHPNPDSASKPLQKLFSFDRAVFSAITAVKEMVLSRGGGHGVCVYCIRVFTTFLRVERNGCRHKHG